jgi:hypothetical protein
MFTGFIIMYNIIRTNKSKIEWLNLGNGEGVTSGMIFSILDVVIIYAILMLID